MEWSRVLIGLGLLLVVAGLLWPVLSRLGLGRLPGASLSSGTASRSMSRLPVAFS